MTVSPLATRLVVAMTLLVPACGEDSAPNIQARNDAGQTDSAKTGGMGNPGGSGGSGGASQSGGGGGQATGMDAAATRDSGADADASMTESLCAKYGGPDVLMSVMQTEVLSRIAGDCRVSAFFATVHPEIIQHVGECLGFMAQELFGCPGAEYAGSVSSTDRPCRSMEESHAGLKISKGDFDAVIDDVVAGLAAAGVEEADIMAAAPALLGMQDDIVEDPSVSTTQAICEAGAADASDAEADAQGDAGAADAGADG